MPPAHKANVTITPNPANLGQIVTVRVQWGVQGPQVTIWLQQINHDLMPDADSVLLTSLEVTNETFSYDFQLQQQIGPNQAEQMISILPDTVYGIVVVGSNQIIGLGLAVRAYDF